LPDARATLVPGGHLIHPAHPAVLELLHEGAAPRSGERTVSP
jgi:hypothetical protein